MFKTGDHVVQLKPTRSIPNGAIGEIQCCLLTCNNNTKEWFHEIKFNVNGKDIYRLRYESELRLYSSSPTFNIGDRVRVSYAALHTYNQEGEIVHISNSGSPYPIEVKLDTQSIHNGNSFFAKIHLTLVAPRANYSSTSAKAFATMFGGSIPKPQSISNSCQHTYIKYTGLIQQFEYCSKCDAKKG